MELKSDRDIVDIIFSIDHVASINRKYIKIMIRLNGLRRQSGLTIYIHTYFYRVKSMTILSGRFMRTIKLDRHS